MTPPATPAERAAYSHMQARLIDLLLRHDEQGFQRLIEARTGTTEADDGLRRYRELGVLFVLRDELFEHILPRIVRRLSFESPRTLVIEEPPAHGRVNWERTLDATWTERPGEPPLLLHTRQRRRDFATPENLLTVATLLEYQADVQRLLWDEEAAVGAAALRHPLNAIVERCERELTFPQFAGLRQAAQQILHGAEAGTETLELRVQERLIPGGNSAYEELLHWRERKRRLALLGRSAASAADALGADPARDHYLYQLWIFFELADLLRDQGALEQVVTTPGAMRVRFRWGAGDEICSYELRHDQQVPLPVARWMSDPVQRYAVPGVRPDFYLWRTDPLLERIPQVGKLIWREPGIIWDAKYYREREGSQAPSSPVKRMIADMTLLGEPAGALLFAFLKAANTNDREHAPVPTGAGYRLQPADRDQTLVPDQELSTWQLQPVGDGDRQQMRTTLTALLDAAHARLGHPRIPACHGVFLDTLSASDRQRLVDRTGAALDDDPNELLICPKPHIGPWRVDLVSRARHCCQDGQLCQIIGRPGSHKPLRPPRSAEDLLKELQHLFTDTERADLDDATIGAIARQVETITRRFAEIAGAYRKIEVYYNRLRDFGMHATLDLLEASERESLALAIFLVEQLDSINASDYSAPAIHLSSVMEVEVRKRIFACPGLKSNIAEHWNQTLGKLPFMRSNPQKFSGDWERIVAHVGQHWHGSVNLDAPEGELRFDTLVTELDQVKTVRNKAAHTTPVARKEYGQLFRIICQSGRLNIGALNALLLAWRF